MHRVFYLLSPLVFVLTFLLPACGGIDEPPGEYRVCCNDGEPAGGGCPADSCPENEAVAEAQSALSIAASAVYTITDEAGFACDGEPSTCATSCGDGVVAGLEECDDGNTTSADGCSSSCTSEVCTCQ